MLALSRLRRFGVRGDLVIALCVSFAVLDGCAGTTHGPSASSVTAGRLAQLRRTLPAGFSAPGAPVPSSARVQLPVSPAAGLRASQVHLAPFPRGAALRSALAAVINLPNAVIVRPLFVSAATVHAGEMVTVAATHLSTEPHHAVLFVLQGPSYRAARLVAAANRVAAGVMTLPSGMRPGQWYVAVQDLSELHGTSTGSVTGSALIGLGALTVR